MLAASSNPVALHDSALKRALDQLRFPASLTNTADRFVYTNRAFQDFYGYTEQELAGLSPKVLVPSDFPVSKLRKIKSEVVENPRGWSGTLLNCRKNGDVVLVRLWTHAIRPDVSLPPLYYLGLAEPIDQGEQAVEELCRSMCSVLLGGCNNGREAGVKASVKSSRGTRQTEIFRLRAMGYGIKEIASIMDISPSTVRVVLWKVRKAAK